MHYVFDPHCSAFQRVRCIQWPCQRSTISEGAKHAEMTNKNGIVCCMAHMNHSMYHTNKNRRHAKEKKKELNYVASINYPCSKIGVGHIDFKMLKWTKPFHLYQCVCDWLQLYTVQLFLADCVSHLFHLYMQWHSHNFLLRHINTRLWVVYSSDPC